jgi:hypothetical protein
MKTRTAFLAFLSVASGWHDAFLDWHELDHRPENHGGIGHVFHSERFVLPPQAHRDLAAQGPFADPGQYLMDIEPVGVDEHVRIPVDGPEQDEPGHLDAIRATGDYRIPDDLYAEIEFMAEATGLWAPR